MFKILVADDEKFIRKGIITILQRDLKEEVTCLEARNGIEALKIAENESPNLIITDINMPGYNGLEFIEKLKRTDSKSTVIILSGYENFEYARNAIKLGVKEYILKPIKKQEFLELINQYVTNIKSVENRTKEEIIRNIENNKIMGQLKHDFLVGLLNCANSEEANNYLMKLKSVGMTFQSMLYACAVVQYKINQENEDYIDFAIANILEEYLNIAQDKENVFVVRYEHGKAVVIFEGMEQRSLQEMNKKLLRKAGSLLKEYCHTEVFIGLGDISYDSIHLYKSLKHALEAVDLKIYQGGDCIEMYSELPKGPEYESLKIEKLLKPLENINSIQTANIFEFLVKEKKSLGALNTIKNAYKEFQYVIYNQIGHYSYLENKPVKSLKVFSDFWSLSELKTEVRECIEEVQKIITDGNTVISNKKLMAEIIRYIQENITSELDLNIVARQFSRTPGYISALFKKVTKGGFNTYITHERIKIAKRLLEDSTVSIQEVGELCGYPNPKYFSVVFKKIAGESPKVYREKMMKEHK